MIVHLVMFRFKPGVSRQDARVVAVAKAMEDLPKQIPVIRSWHHGFNMSEDALAWDYGLQAIFNSEADLQTYFEHPAHLPVLELWDEIATLGFTDFIV